MAITSVLAASGCKSNPDRHPADNTAQNARDKADVPTADQAGQGKSDIDVAQQVRRAIVDDETLSTNAHNCKVVVKDGIVTLAGPVASATERTKVESIAGRVAGATEVVNELEIVN